MSPEGPVRPQPAAHMGLWICCQQLRHHSVCFLSDSGDAASENKISIDKETSQSGIAFFFFWIYVNIATPLFLTE